MPKPNTGAKAAILALGNMKASEVVETLKKQGLHATTAYVYTVRSDYRKAHGIPARAPLPEKTVDVQPFKGLKKASVSSTRTVDINDAIAMCKYADDAGLSDKELQFAVLAADIGMVRVREILEGIRKRVDEYKAA